VREIGDIKVNPQENDSKHWRI